MTYFTPLPPALYEIINCALFASSSAVLVLCGRYLLSAYLTNRRAPSNSGLGLGFFAAIYELRKLRLALGLMIFLLGEAPRMGYLWISRYLANTGHDVTWLSQHGFVLIPIIGSSVAVFGLACIARAIIPIAWGRYGYSGTLLIALFAIVSTQVIRDLEELAYFSILVAVVLSLSSLAWRALMRLRDT